FELRRPADKKKRNYAAEQQFVKPEEVLRAKRSRCRDGSLRSRERMSSGGDDRARRDSEVELIECTGSAEVRGCASRSSSSASCALAIATTSAAGIGRPGRRVPDRMPTSARQNAPPFLMTRPIAQAHSRARWLTHRSSAKSADSHRNRGSSRAR